MKWQSRFLRISIYTGSSRQKTVSTPTQQHSAVLSDHLVNDEILLSSELITSLHQACFAVDSLSLSLSLSLFLMVTGISYIIIRVVYSTECRWRGAVRLGRTFFAKALRDGLISHFLKTFGKRVRDCWRVEKERKGQKANEGGRRGRGTKRRVEEAKSTVRRGGPKRAPQQEDFSRDTSFSTIYIAQVITLSQCIISFAKSQTFLWTRTMRLMNN